MAKRKTARAARERAQLDSLDSLRTGFALGRRRQQFEAKVHNARNSARRTNLAFVSGGLAVGGILYLIFKHSS